MPWLAVPCPLPPVSALKAGPKDPIRCISSHLDGLRDWLDLVGDGGPHLAWTCRCPPSLLRSPSYQPSLSIWVLVASSVIIWPMAAGLKLLRNRASTTGSRSLHSRTRWARICPLMVVSAASFSRSRPLTACQGPKQSLLHLHSHSHAILHGHGVPATCLSTQQSSPADCPVCQGDIIPSSVRSTPRPRGAQISGLLRALGRDLQTSRVARRAAPRTGQRRVLSACVLYTCLPVLPVYPGMTGGRSCRTAGSRHRHTVPHTTHTHPQNAAPHYWLQSMLQIQQYLGPSSFWHGCDLVDSGHAQCLPSVCHRLGFAAQIPDPRCWE